MIELPPAPVLRAHLTELGLLPGEIRALVESGGLRRELHGCYCRGDVPDTIELRAQCAALLLGAGVVVCDRFASWLHGIDSFDYAELDLVPPLEVVAVGGRDRTRLTGTLGGKRALLSEDVCEVYGVPVTTPLRTCCDLACLRTRNAALAVLDAFRRVHGVTEPDLNRMLRRFRGRRGVKQLRELIPLSSPDRESTGESWTAMAIHDDGHPLPKPQVWVLLPELGWIRLDMAYRHLRIAIEYDGEEFHTSEEDKNADEKRRDALRRAGWIVIVVRMGDFTNDTCEVWLSELRAAIRERTPAGRPRHSRGESWEPRRSRR